MRGEIMVDAYSNVYIVSSTRSRDLPVSATAFQKKYGGGGQDGCIAKFSYDLSHLIWCSYIGGDSSDAAYSMVLDKDNNIYVCGGTSSSNLPTTKGVMQPSYGGGVSDGFIAYVSTNGNQIKAMTY
ncbi:MAG: SBBP repeat-containing protein, partial [Bacteroidales bacterium]|nr:SBBP repeat-containing protein [Bacteroidales bacterium]